MLAERLDQLDTCICSLLKNIENMNIDDAVANTKQIEKLLEQCFASSYMSNTDVSRLESILNDFNNLITKVASLKADTAKSLGTHLKTQKKLDIYKSIK